jgi:hypothetical protein
VNGHIDPYKSCIVKRALKGIARAEKAPDERASKTMVLLHQISMALKSVCYSDHNKMFKSAFSTALFGLFRIGGFVSASKKTAHK